jgi:putative solute:sodium symporter small subunit
MIDVDNNKVLYWKKTISFTLMVMAIWAFFGFVPTILFVDQMNSMSLGGAPLGFWFAQNGSIYAFWFLTLWYAIKMGKQDEEFDLHE